MYQILDKMSRVGRKRILGGTTMKTNVINTMEDVNILNLTDESEYISVATNIPYNTVLDIIKGIDVYYYLVGIQGELTFDDDECEMFLDGSIQPQEYDPDYVVDDEEMLAFISSHTDIPDETIERVMMEDLKYQGVLPTPVIQPPVIQRQSDTWSKETKAALCPILLDRMFKNPYGEKLIPSNVYKYNTPMFGRKSIDYSDIKIRL